jgi:hypothetical protein
VSRLGADGPVFSVGGRSYDRSDIVVAAVLRGEWTILKERLRCGLACVRRAGDEGWEAPEADLEAAAREFRYARNLITAQETEEWLGNAGLTFEDWSAHLERSLLANGESRTIADVASRYPVPDEDLDDHLYAEAVCSGALERFTDTLAGRAAVFARVKAIERVEGCEVDPSRVAEAAREVERTFGSCGRPVSDESTARIATMARIEATFQAFARSAVTPSSMRAQIDLHRLDWIRVDWRHICLPEQAAKEAALCLWRDGEAFADVAARAGVGICSEAVFVDEIDPGVRAAVISARPKELLGPVASEGGFRLLVVDVKKAPSEDDADVRHRAAEAVTEALVAEAKKHVQWHARF